MGIKTILQEELHLPPAQAALLPSSFQRLGDIILVPIHPRLRRDEKRIGRAIRAHFSVAAVYARGQVDGELRQPKVRLLAGTGKIATVREHGCTYSLDVTKLMFSQGNQIERVRLTPRPKETIIDMFAGIGYFSIPLAKKDSSCRVIAIEKNPTAFRYLEKNIRLNRLDNILAVKGDCRTFQIEGDRVLMGYFPNTKMYLPTALSFLPRGGMLHYHTLSREPDLWTIPEREVREAAKKVGFQTEVTHRQQVKQFAPHVWHVVLDVRVKKTPSKKKA